MKTIVIIGCIMLLGIILFAWYMRITRPDRKKLKIVHRKADEMQVA